MKKTSLKKTILNVLIIFTIVISVVVGALSAYSLYKSKISTLLYNQEQVLRQVEIESIKFLDEIEFISTYLVNEYEQDADLLKNLVELNKNISGIIVLNNEGIINDFFSETNLNIFRGFDYSFKNYYLKIKEGNSFYWSDIFLSTIDEDQSITYSFRMNDNSIAVIFIKLNELSSFCKRYKNIDETHMIRIFDNNGIMILNPDRPEIVSQQFNARSSSVYLDLIDAVPPFTQKSFNSVLNDKLEIGMYTIVNKIGWKIVIREDYIYLIDSLKEILIKIFSVMAIFIIISIYIALKIARRVFIEIDKFNKNIAEISAGNYDIDIENSPYKEFEQFSKSFQMMQDEIEKREDSLEDSLNSFKSLVNSTMEAIIIHEDGICVDANDVAVKLFGYENKNEIVGKEFISLAGMSSKRMLEENLAVETEPYEIEFIKKDGSSFITLGQGKFLNVFGRKQKVSTIIDITELKHKDKLISQQSKMASMGEMIGNIAHQWRQPLSTISTAASGIKLHKELGILEDKDFKEGLDAIVSSTKFLSKTIDDFRNFFKSDKKEERFELSLVIENVLSLLGSSLKNNEIEVEKFYEENVEIFGYQNELTQAVINIINNAKDILTTIDYKEKKVVVITVSKNLNSAKISIKDSGGGIPDNILPSIFEPYFTTKHKSQGTGIGLYMSHQIIVSHMKGSLIAQNCEFEYKGEKLYGAEFIIEFKTNINDKYINYEI